MTAAERAMFAELVERVVRLEARVAAEDAEQEAEQERLCRRELREWVDAQRHPFLRRVA